MAYYFMVVSFIGRGKQHTYRKPLTNFITLKLHRVNHMQQSNLQQAGSTVIEKVDLNTITLRVMVPRIIILPYV